MKKRCDFIRIERRAKNPQRCECAKHRSSDCHCLLGPNSSIHGEYSQFRRLKPDRSLCHQVKCRHFRPAETILLLDCFQRPSKNIARNPLIFRDAIELFTLAANLANAIPRNGSSCEQSANGRARNGTDSLKRTPKKRSSLSSSKDCGPRTQRDRLPSCAINKVPGSLCT